MLLIGQVQDWTVNTVIKILCCSQEEAIKLVTQLESADYINKAGTYETVQYYSNSIKGNSLAQASAAKLLTRKTANKKLEELLERVKEVNGNEYYLYKVARVEVFGSYLSGKERISDIDLIINMKHKQESFEADYQRIQEAKLRGRRFGFCAGINLALHGSFALFKISFKGN